MSVKITTILIVGISVVLLLPLAARVAQRRFDPFEPIAAFALAWGVMFVSRPAGMLVRDDLVFFDLDISAALDNALLLALLGAVAFVLGYELSVGKGLARCLPLLKSGEIEPRALVRACLAGALGIAVFALALLSVDGVQTVRTYLGGRSPSLDDVLNDSPLFLWWFSLLVVPAALAAFAITLGRPRLRTVLPTGMLVALALFRTLPTGSRLYLLILVGGMVVFCYLHLQRRPGIATLAVAFAIALLGSQAVVTFRYHENRQDIAAAARTVLSLPTNALSPLFKGSDSEMAPALAGALTVVPDELHYRFGGATLGDLLVRPVPRAFWSEKPLPHTQQVTARVWPEAQKLGGFDPAYSPLLSFYWDFGVAGVLFGMAGYGILARVAYEYFLRAVESPAVQIIFAAAFWTVVVAVRYDPVLLFMHSVVVFLPLIFIVRTRTRSHRRFDRIRPWSRLPGWSR